MQESYTIKKTSTKLFTLSNVASKETVKIDNTHPKFKYVSQQGANRIIKINGTKMTASNDYSGYYDSKPQPTKSVEVKFTKLDDLNIDASLFTPMPTNTVFDKFVSNEGGFLPGTNIMAAGAPGIGKTTILLDLLSRLAEQGKRVLFISAEMSQIDMARYLQRFPAWGQLPILFLSDYTDNCPKTVIESALKQGWDLVLTDSYTEVNDTVKEACNLTRTKTEKWFLDLMISNNKANNDLKKYTTFVTILQLSKGGQFVGSNKLKHMTTSMMHLDWDGQENSGRRFMEFSKNRVGQVGKKLYFDLEGGVSFDEARFARDLFNDEIVQEERKALSLESNAFDELFGLGTPSEEAPVEGEMQEK